MAESGGKRVPFNSRKQGKVTIFQKANESKKQAVKRYRDSGYSI